MVVRAIFFDFYSVWTPDKFAEYIVMAEQRDPNAAQELKQIVQQYYLGIVDITRVTDAFKFKLNDATLSPDLFILKPNDISPALIEFMRNLHGHFLKLGMLANIGKQEYDILTGLNAQYQLFEVIVGSLNAGSTVYTQEVFVKALQDIGEPPASCFVVTGDTAYQRFAESCGIPVMPFQGFPHLKQSLDHIIETS